MLLLISPKQYAVLILEPRGERTIGIFCAKKRVYSFGIINKELGYQMSQLCIQESTSNDYHGSRHFIFKRFVETLPVS